MATKHKGDNEQEIKETHVDELEEIKERTGMSNEQLIDKSLNAFALYEFIEKIEQRKIYLFGDIDTEKIQFAVQQIYTMEKRSEDDIEIIINSDGGYVSDCLALIDIMDSSTCDFRTTVVGRADSAACLIASNGTKKKRRAGRNSEFMYHETYYANLSEVKPSEVRYWHREALKADEKFLKIFARNTGKTPRKIKDMFYSTHLDKFMDAEEAKKFGIVDCVMPVRRSKRSKKTIKKGE